MSAPFATGLEGEGSVFHARRFEPLSEPPAARLPTFVASRFAAVPVPAREWHVDGLLPAQSVTLLMADGAVGKSTLAIQLSSSTVLGRPWLGRSCLSGPVLLFSAEDDLDEIHRRLDAVVVHEKVTFDALDTLTIVPLAGKDAVLAAPDGRDGLLKPTALFAALTELVAATRPALLVLDTLADTFGGDEIKKVHARQFVTMLRGLAVDHHMAVLLIGHPSQAGMSTGAGTSGNVAWSNSVRSRLYLDRVRTTEGAEIDADVRTLTVKKTNYAQSGQSIALRWRDGVFVVEQGAARQIGPASAAHVEQVFLDLLGEFTRQGRTVSPSRSPTFAPAVFNRDPSAKGISLKAFEAAMNVLLRDGGVRIVTTGSPARQRSHLAIAPGRVPERGVAPR